MKKIILSLFAITLLVSCSDFLHEEPDEQISHDEQLSTKEGVLEAVNGMYLQLRNVSGGNNFLYPDLQGGNITFCPEEGKKIIAVPVAIADTYDFNNSAEDSEFNALYANLYEVIYSANLLLDKVNESSGLTTEELKEMQAECLMVRAYAHYMLTLFYAQNYNYTADASHLGIVYMDRPFKGEYEYPARLTMKQTYERIKTDLDQALSLFRSKPILPYGAENTYFNPISARAVYAQIALQMNDWANAEKYALEVIQQSGKSLTTNANYIAEWDAKSNPSETIMELSLSRDVDNVVGYSTAKFYGYTSKTAHERYVATKDLYDLYGTNDIRKQLYGIAPIYDKATGSISSYQSTIVTTTVGSTDQEIQYYFSRKNQNEPILIVARLSEMYLIAAEAMARQSKPTEALTYLNPIVERAGLTAYTDTSDILEKIFLERRKELAFEGRLFFDIVRYKKNVERNTDCMSSVCSMAYPSNYFVLPIPKTNVSANQNMKQNPGYN